MSADSGVYILHTRDNFKIVRDHNGLVGEIEKEVSTAGIKTMAYRVAYAQAIDNFDWYETNQPYMLGKYMHEVWGRSPVYYNYTDAFEAAKELQEKIGYTEYGICDIVADKYSFN